jgi:hypothetical protein
MIALDNPYVTVPRTAQLCLVITCPCTSTTNGVAKRANRTIEEHVIAMLEESCLPPSFLGQAVAAYVLNIS